MFGKDQGGESFGVDFLLFRRQETDGFGEIVDTVVVEIAGDLEVYIVRLGALAGDGEPAFAGQKAVGPFDDDLVGDAFAAHHQAAVIHRVVAREKLDVVDRPQGGADGIVSEGRKGLLGESWANGKVILAWDNVLHGSSNFVDGQNVVLHEFAHQLDSESGSTNGAPILAGRNCLRTWAGTLSGEFEDLQKDAWQGKRSLIDHYGATNPAEFFAVSTETFFEKPSQMAKHHEELFEVLKCYYHVDPRDWQT